MKRLLIVFAALLASALAATTSSAAAIYMDPLYGISITKNIVYTKAQTSNKGLVDLKLDVYQPTYKGLAPVLSNRPAIVIQDGGAWVSADKGNGRVTTIANYMAERGYTVVVSDYRQGANNLFGAGGDVVPIVGKTTFGTQPYAGLSVPAIYQVFPGTTAIRAGIEDFAVAMAWTRTNAASLGINPNLIAAAGGSAGGIDNLMLQYNNNPVNPAYAAQAVIGLVSSLYGNESRVKPGGPPVFLLNNTQDVVVPWSPNMDPAFAAAGIYYEQWFQPPDATYHNVDWNLNLGGENLKERVRDFLAFHFVGGPIEVPEPSTLVLGVTAIATLSLLRLRAAKKK